MTSAQVETVAANIRRLVAPNPSPMTFNGTNTYIVGTGEVAIIDPGPAMESHLQNILSALESGERVSHILLTHSHVDHSALASILSERTGAPIHAYGPSGAGQSEVMRNLSKEGAIHGGEGIDRSFRPDNTIKDGEVISGSDWSLTAHHTPGHMSNHMCFQLEGHLLTGDHIMGWSTSLISPPDGDLGAFMSSCIKLIGLGEFVYLPGHGDVVPKGAARTAEILQHRMQRENQILQVLTSSPASTSDIVAKVYPDLATNLGPAAARNVLAHLIDLWERGIITAQPTLSATAVFAIK